MMSTNSCPRPGPVVSVLSLLTRFAPTGWKYFYPGVLFRRRYDYVDEPPALEGLQSIWAGAREIEYMDKHPEATSPRAYARRAARGDMCLCLKQGEEIIGYQWVAKKSACLFCGFSSRYELLFFPLRADQVFMYDAYVYRARQRQGYGTLIRKLIYKEMQKQGVREQYALVALDNIPALKITLALGDEPWSMAYGIRIRNWSKMILGPRPDKQLIRWLDKFKTRTESTAQ
jgi:GNAT superfamily N-acetyltransferase